LIDNKIKIVKYNYSIDPTVQTYSCFEGYMHLSLDGKELMIVNKKPLSSKDYVLEADPNEIRKL
jgi:hypothetical protein